MSGGAKKGRPRVRLTSGGPYERSTHSKGRQQARGRVHHRRRGKVRRSRLGWTAACTCGWRAQRESKALALEACEDHLRLKRGRRKQRAKNSKRSMPGRAAHKLSLLEGPNGRWTAKCKCGWQNEEPRVGKALEALQDHRHESGGVWRKPPEVRKALSRETAKRNIRLRRRQLERTRETATESEEMPDGSS